MSIVNANPPASPAQSAEVDISIFTPAHLRETPKEGPKDDGATQPEAEAVDAADVQQQADDGADDADDGGAGEGEGDERRKRSTSDRIKRLTAQQRYWEREALALRARLDALEKPAAGQPPENQPLTAENASGKEEAVKAPEPSKYRYGELDPQYISDLADYRAELKLQQFRKEQMDAQQAAAADRELDQVRAKAAEVTTAGKAKFSDFEEVVVRAAEDGEYELTREMFETAATTPVAAEILYHLAKNPTEALAVSRMNPREQGMWFGRMEAKFSASAPKPEPKRISDAPDPLTPARGSGASVATPAATMDFAAFERMALQRG